MDHVSLIPVTDIHRWERNPRLHPDSNIAQLCGSLRQFGLARLPVLATWPGQTEGCIIAGNGITAALKRMYEADPAHPPQGVDPGSPWMIPVRPRTFDSQLAAEKYGLVDNWSTEASEDDPLLVAPILQELQAFGDDLTGLFLSVDEVGLMMNPPNDTPEPEDTEVKGGDGEAQGEPHSQLGEVYELGPHRLVCGDSRDALVWAKLLPNGERLQMVWTDPPYGVSYVGKTEDALTIQNDSMKPAELEQFLRDALGIAAAHTAPGGAWYVAAPPGPSLLHFAKILTDLGIWRQLLAWVKDQFVMGRSDFHYRHEDIFYGWVPGAAHYFIDDRTQDSVLEFARPKRSKEHPTMKPVELVAYCIGNSSKRGWIVGEPFGGSGTTLIACAQTGRIARLIELDPRYCDVIRRRWTKWAKEAGVNPGSGSLDV